MADPGFDERHIVITGAGTGIGRAIAERLGAEGARLTLLGRRLDRLEETRTGIESPAVACLSCDIRDRAAVNETFAAAAAELGPVNALVANAGIGGANHPASSDAGGEDRFDDIVATNVNGTYSCIRAALHHFAPVGSPRHIVVIASILGRIGVPLYTGYCTSKAALLGMVRAFAVELADSEIPVNAICPGWVNTRMARDGIDAMARDMGTSHDEALRIAMEQVPLGRMSEPEEIAAFTRWLLTPETLGITGQGLDINNGAFMS